MGIKDILRSGLGELTGAAFKEAQRQQAKPCANAMHHQRQYEKLERRAMTHRVFALRARLGHHRLWKRFWESRCEALNLCPEKYDKGC